MALRKFGWLDTAIGVWKSVASGDSLDPVAGGTGVTSVTTGDVLYGSGSNVWSKLAVGATGLALTVSGGIPAWAVLGVVGGGTGLAIYAVGDIVYASGTTTLAKLPIGTAGQILQVNPGATAPTWVDFVGQTQSVTNGNGSTVAKLAPVYIKSDGNFAAAKADSTSTYNVFGLTSASINSLAAGAIYTEDGAVLTGTTGEWDAICGTTGGLTPGAIYYLSGATAGLLTATPPSTSGHIQVRVLVALSATKAKFEPQVIGMA